MSAVRGSRPASDLATGPGSVARPLAVTDAIPLAAAGLQPLFFFGTLMDADVLAKVVDRPVAREALRPGRLAGFRRMRGLNVTYPVLVPARMSSVAGRLWPDAGRRDIHRINHFESGEYRAELHPVVDALGTVHRAWLFIGLDRAPMAASAEPWRLEAWQREHKSTFMAACDRWMADCAEPA